MAAAVDIHHHIPLEEVEEDKSLRCDCHSFVVSYGDETSPTDCDDDGNIRGVPLLRVCVYGQIRGLCGKRELLKMCESFYEVVCEVCRLKGFGVVAQEYRRGSTLYIIEVTEFACKRE